MPLQKWKNYAALLGTMGFGLLSSSLTVSPRTVLPRLEMAKLMQHEISSY